MNAQYFDGVTHGGKPISSLITKTQSMRLCGDSSGAIASLLIYVGFDTIMDPDLFTHVWVNMQPGQPAVAHAAFRRHGPGNQPDFYTGQAEAWGALRVSIKN